MTYIKSQIIFQLLQNYVYIHSLYSHWFINWSTTRFICTRYWLQIFCKLCLSEKLNNLINRAVTARYAHVMLTYTDQALHCNAYKQQDHVIKWSCDQIVNKSSRRSDQLSQYTDQALHCDAHKQLKAYLVCLIKWLNSERKLTLKWSTFTTHWSFN